MQIYTDHPHMIILCISLGLFILLQLAKWHLDLLFKE